MQYSVVVFLFCVLCFPRNLSRLLGITHFEFSLLLPRTVSH